MNDILNADTRKESKSGAYMTAAALQNRDKILDVREERAGATPFEFREDEATGQVVLRGYAATYEPYDCYGGPEAGGWVEQLRSNSFDRTLDANPDVMLLLNHTGAPLARTKSGTMTLRADRHGLFVEARLDPSDPDVQALLPKMRRGDLDEMSFAFRVKDQEWDTNYTHRTITEVSLQKGDVSVVNYGMNPNTQVAIAEGTVGALAKLSRRELAELRRLDSGLIKRAISNLRAVAQNDDEEYSMDDDMEEQKGCGGQCAAGSCEQCDSMRACKDDMEEKSVVVVDDDDEEGECPDCGDSPCSCDQPQRSAPTVDASVASALESSLMTAYSLAAGNPALQRKLKTARGQLNQLRGDNKEQQRDVSEKLLLLRKEYGLPATSSVADAFEYLKREGTDPASAVLTRSEPIS